MIGYFSPCNIYYGEIMFRNKSALGSNTIGKVIKPVEPAYECNPGINPQFFRIEELCKLDKLIQL